MNQLLKLAKGEYLFREGQPADAMYLIKSGSFEVVMINPFTKEEIVRGPYFAGNILGELSLFDGRRREESFRATQDSEVQILPYENILSHCEELPPWAEALMKTMISHLRSAIQYVRAKDHLPLSPE